ncbi:MAG: OmpA family protein [Planctomycetota bacterium]|nr:OmpA family protein [Planctomycetota bacterium]
MGKFGVILGSIAIMGLGSGCVGMKQHKKLEDQFQRQEAYVKKHKNDMRQATRETTRVALKLREKELEVQKLEAKNKDLSYQLVRAEKKANERPTAPASFKKESPQTAAVQAPKTLPTSYSNAPATPSISGFKVNSKSNGIVLDQAKVFASGSARLTKSGKSTLAKLAKAVNKSEYRRYKVRVEGHTDSSPITRSKTVKDNWQLSGMRARAVLNYLESRGVSSKRLSFAGYSYFKPFTKDSSKSGKAKNRRVEVLLVE